MILHAASTAAANGIIHSQTRASAPKVAIIGAGAAGLVTARIFSRNGIQPLVLEKDDVLGGVWQYFPTNKSSSSTKSNDNNNNQNENNMNDEGINTNVRTLKKDRPMYRGLRTNLPREVMAFREKKWGGDGGMSFVTHQDVASYLSDYAKEFNLEQFISYGCSVEQLTICQDDDDDQSDNNQHLDDIDESLSSLPKIKLEWSRKQSSNTDNDNNTSTTISRTTETFDAVMVCNGHYAAPSIPNLPGLHDKFHGKVMHSIEYDDPKDFEGQTVLCIGGRASGSDLAREISFHAKKVYLSDTSCPPSEDGRPTSMGNVYWVPKTMKITKDSAIHFDGSCVDTPTNVDVIIFCTGYDYQFPFINSQSNIPKFAATPGERRVMPLYEHLWHPTYPNLAFVGLQHSVVPFPFFELQAEAIVAQLFNKEVKNTNNDDNDGSDNDRSSKSLPSLEKRLSIAEADANAGGPNEVGRVQDTHFLGSFQWDACRKYAQYAGNYDEAMERFIATNKAIYDATGKQRKSLFPGGPDDYRYYSFVRDEDNKSFQVISLREGVLAK